LLPCSPASPLVSRHLGHSNNRAEVCRRVPFCPWDSWGSPLERGLVGILRGSRRNANYSAKPCPYPLQRRPPWRSMTHRDERPRPTLASLPTMSGPELL
jgi:hypothetical protein